jgi:hypothetical protein
MKTSFLSALCVGHLLFGHWTQSSGQIPPCGNDLATYAGVAAKSNGEFQGSGASCAGRGIYGLQYQCVEYIKRFYAEALSVDTSQWRLNAVDFFDQAPSLALISFGNGESTSPPAANDIIVFGSTRNNSYGHVAVVAAVSPDFITCIEQNWSSTGTNTLGLLYQNGFYTIQPRGFYRILGWLRRPLRQIVLQPGPGEGKDIWTTSVYSYAPDGSFPGGGLDNYELVIGGWGDLYYSLLQFDLSGLPRTARSAHLELFCFTQRGIATTGIYVDRIAQFWDWRIQGTGRDRLRLWWADRPTAEQWIPQALAAPTVGQWYRIDVTDLYNAWQDGSYPNFGLQLRPESSNNRWAEFYSSDYIDDPSLRPKLVVE